MVFLSRIIIKNTDPYGILVVNKYETYEKFEKFEKLIAYVKLKREGTTGFSLVFRIPEPHPFHLGCFQANEDLKKKELSLIMKTDKVSILRRRITHSGIMDRQKISNFALKQKLDRRYSLAKLNSLSELHSSTNTSKMSFRKERNRPVRTNLLSISPKITKWKKTHANFALETKNTEQTSCLSHAHAKVLVPKSTHSVSNIGCRSRSKKK